MSAPQPGKDERIHPTRRGQTVRSGNVLALGFVTLVLVGALSVLLTSAALEAQTGATNFVTSEGYWSKGRSEAIQALYAYATTGERPELRRAPADAARMVRFYRLLSDVPYVRRGVELWRRADESLLRLVTIADELEAAQDEPDAEERVLALRRELGVVNAALRPMELAFSRTLADGVRRLRDTLLWVMVASFLLVTLITAAVLGWAYGRVRLNERNLRATFEQAAVGMARLDPRGRFLDANEALCRLLGRSRDELLAMTLTDVVHEEERAAGDGTDALAETGPGGSDAVETRFVRSDGSTMWGRMTLSRIELGGGGGTHLFAIVEDVSEARRLSEELDYRARYDMLTGLINRFEIERRLEAAVAAEARHGEPHALCFLDLDQFKIVNDTCGHAAGDHLLRQVASLLTRSLRTNDVVGRLGGDEFAIILDHAGLEEARRVTNELRRALAEHVFRWDERSFDVTCSIGFVEIRGGDDAASWLRKADIACYLAKEGGRNRVHAYVEGDEALVERQGQMEWVGRIRDAVREERLTLHAQRIVPVTGDPLLRYELLLRLEDEGGRSHAPEAFMPAAERYGLATALDRWVVNETLTTLARHPEHLAALGRCHLNLSAHSISSDEFRTFLETALDDHAVPGSKLCFEITETAVIRDLANARALIASLRARGCVVALDDFGSGVSSFGHLKSLPVDLVKIDGVFVRGMVEDELDRAIVRSVHEVAKALGRETVAEFVHDEGIRAVLEEIGVDYVQGRAIHAPAPWGTLLREG